MYKKPMIDLIYSKLECLTGKEHAKLLAFRAFECNVFAWFHLGY